MNNKAIPINKNIYPIIQDKNGDGFSCFVIANTSDEVVNDIKVYRSDSAVDYDIYYSIVKTGIISGPSDFQPGILSGSTLFFLGGYPYLLPGEAITLFAAAKTLSAEYTTIDITDIQLDISYSHSNIINQNLIRHFEFTNSLNYVNSNIVNGSYAITDSMDNPAICSDGITGEHVIKGDGCGYFENAGDSVTSQIQSGLAEFSIFIKGIFFPLANVNTICSIKTTTGTTIRLNMLRNIEITSTLGSIVSDQILSDVYGEHIIGVSMNSLGGLILTLDGSPLTMNGGTNIFEAGDHLTIGSLTTETTNMRLSDVLVFTDFKSPSFHKHIANKL
jgi:hypothetical protein